jgi:hypothetical protein
MRDLRLIFIVLLLLCIPRLESEAQCASCTHTINGNAAQPTLSDGDILCITGARTNGVTINNTISVTVCIDAGASMSGAIPGNNTVTNNYGTLSGNRTFNNNMVLNNYGTRTGITTVQGNAVFNNYGSAEGISVSGGGKIFNHGLISSSTITIGSGGSLTNEPSGQIIKTGGGFLMNQSNSLFVNRGYFQLNDGNLTIDNNSAVFNSGDGTIYVGNGNFEIKRGTVTVGEVNLQNGTLKNEAVLNINGPITLLNGNFENVGTMNALLGLQCNTITVLDGKIKNDGTMNINPGGLQIDEDNFDNSGTINGIPNTDASCPCILENTVIVDGDEVVIIIFRCPGEHSWSPPEGLEEYEVLVVGGGGAGGSTASSGGTGRAGGGGGGGAVKYNVFNIPGGIPGGQTYDIFVGAGGIANSNDAALRNGQASSFDNGSTAILAGGGGAGGRSNGTNGQNGSNGSSGGGAGAQGNSPNTGSGGLGDNAGSDGGDSFRSTTGSISRGGGGGSFNSNGQNANSTRAGYGSPGELFLITNQAEYFGAGGGGGSSQNLTFGLGGNGGGGTGGDANRAAIPGLPNTGSGGGGAGGNNQPGGNGGSGVVIIRYETSRILPVEFLYFNGRYILEDRMVQLKWGTAYEWENSHFEIERSLGNIDNFRTIGKKEGLGWSDEFVDYDFWDKNLPLEGGNIFYRLKQHDLNGTTSYSKVISVRVSGVEYTKGVWRAFPNPIQNQSLSIGILEKSQYNGEIIFFRIVQANASNKPFMATSINEMNEILAPLVPNFPKGILIMEIRWAQKVEYIKVLNR